MSKITYYSWLKKVNQMFEEVSFVASPNLEHPTLVKAYSYNSPGWGEKVPVAIWTPESWSITSFI